MYGSGQSLFHIDTLDDNVVDEEEKARLTAWAGIGSELSKVSQRRSCQEGRRAAFHQEGETVEEVLVWAEQTDERGVVEDRNNCQKGGRFGLKRQPKEAVALDRKHRRNRCCCEPKRRPEEGAALDRARGA